VENRPAEAQEEQDPFLLVEKVFEESGIKLSPTAKQLIAAQTPRTGGRLPIIAALYVGGMLKNHGDALNEASKALRESQEKHLAELNRSMDASQEQAKSLKRATWVLAVATIVLVLVTAVSGFLWYKASLDHPQEERRPGSISYRTASRYYSRLLIDHEQPVIEQKWFSCIRTTSALRYARNMHCNFEKLDVPPTRVASIVRFVRIPTPICEKSPRNIVPASA
jgi:hypothetical protein